MAHGTRINGTVYGISGGKCLVSGTVYSIKNGKALINGTGYSVDFVKGTTLAINTIGFIGDIYLNGTFLGSNISQTYTFEPGETVSLRILATFGQVYINGHSTGFNDYVVDITGKNCELTSEGTDAYLTIK